MRRVGKVARVARYPVKSMAGEDLDEGRLVGYGLEGDRLYAFESDAAPAGMLRVTGRERRELLGYTAWVAAGGEVLVRTPAGKVCPVTAVEGLPEGLRLTCAESPQTDVRPLALLGMATVAKLTEEMEEAAVDARRFRANFLLEMDEGPFAEDGLVGKVVRLGRDAIVLVKERTPRCRVVTYAPQDPVGTEPLFGLMRVLERRHGGRVGVYAAVVGPGMVRVGDEVCVE